MNAMDERGSESGLERIKAKLLERKRALWGEVAADLDQKAGKEHADLIQIVRDRGDQSTAELKESTVLTLIKLKLEESEQLERALRRIDEGTYGRCADCDEPIPPGRLEVMPFAVRCRDCQSEAERLENI